jgi:FAD/FMN-containing dehydrogenase
MTSTDARAAEALRGLCGGAVRLPGDAGYDDARLPWNLQVDIRPAAVAYPAFPDEVAEVVRAAAAVGLPVVPLGTGHGAAARVEDIRGAVLLRTSALTGITLDARRGSVRTAAGVQWGDLVDRAAPEGLTGRHMSSPDVGVVGSSLSGGISWYARAHGLQSSALTAVELVLGDGTLVHADDDCEPDLMWAARGGAGGFGVVTAVEFDLLRISSAYAGALMWDLEQAEPVLRTWAAWAPGAPECITTSLRLLRVPELPWVPEPLRGRRIVLLDGAVVGDLGIADDLLAPFRALGPELDSFGEFPAAALTRLHQEPEGPTPGYARSCLLGALPDAAVDAVLDTLGTGALSRLNILELRQLGGALSRPAGRPAALDHVAGDFLFVALGTDPDPAGWPGMREAGAGVLAALAPWKSGEYLPMSDEAAGSSTGQLHDVSARLAEVRRAADPHGVFTPGR